MTKRIVNIVSEKEGYCLIYQKEGYYVLALLTLKTQIIHLILDALPHLR